MPYQDSTKMIINKFLYQMVTIKEMIEKDPMQFDLLNSFVLEVIMVMNVFSGGVMTSSILMKGRLRRLGERGQLEFTHAIIPSEHLPTDLAQKEISSDQNRGKTTEQSTLTHTVIRSGLHATNTTNTEMIQVCLQPGYRYVNDGNKYSLDPDYRKYIGLLERLPEKLKKVLDKEEELIRKIYDIYGECMFGDKDASGHEIPKGMDEWRDEFLDRYQNIFGNISDIMTTDNNNTVMFKLMNINNKIGMLSTQHDHLCKITKIKCGEKHGLSSEYYNNAVEYLTDLQSLINNIMKNEEKSYFYTAKGYVSKIFNRGFEEKAPSNTRPGTAP
ncbi:hypothetical protein THOM_2643 [Trachipleistophora hominis]|uniref:Uncharacterized protein n=1 Tax=Trachipleistophora hominis TaxID=72359 RepID=L7JSX9_TRAHO|nr:hypothetical protein THOM_2643 [Trachipleistophora hominis]